MIPKRSPAATVIGRPCKNCGSTEKYACNQSCIACSAARARNLSPEARAAKKAYSKQYIATHGPAYSKEEMKEYNRVYNAKKKGVDPAAYRIRGEIPLDERILADSMPVPECGCWLWLKRLDKDGYGHISINGRMVTAPRASLFAFKGVPIDGYDATRHTCDFPPCVNPDHLLPGTNYDNIRDRVERGRTASKLSVEDVIAIRQRQGQGESKNSLAEHFGITWTTIHAIVRRKTWRHIPP